jgi:methanogenic corrinoid protein MtbC1
LLKRATDISHPIGRVAKLTDIELASLVTPKFPVGDLHLPEERHDLLEKSLAAINHLDRDGLLQYLNHSLLIYGVEDAIEFLVIPLITQIGVLWRSGKMRIFQEHMATAIIRSFLTDLLSSLNQPGGHQKIIVATPKNQHHEIGALLAAVGFALQNWNVVYLGPNLPSKDIADAAISSKASGIALSIVYPFNDSELPAELTSLRKYVGPSYPILVGGSGSQFYEATLKHIQAHLILNWKYQGQI